MLWGLKMLLCDFIKNLLLHRLTNNTGPATPTGAGSHAAFLRSKKKKGKQKKKKKKFESRNY